MTKLIALRELPIGATFTDPESHIEFQITGRDLCGIYLEDEEDFDILAEAQEGDSFFFSGDGVERRFASGDSFRFDSSMCVEKWGPQFRAPS